MTTVAARPAAAPPLRAKGISVRYGGVHAVEGIDLEVAAGELVGLIGPNGAGKTTFVDAISGFVSSSGSVEIAGQDVTRLRPHQRARRGLARTWQSSEVFSDLNVAENLQIAAYPGSGFARVRALLQYRPSTELARRVLREMRLDEISDVAGDALSQGQRKLVDVARALALSPRVVCLDEPAAGLDTNETEELGGTLREVASRGVGILLIDHDMGLVLSVCDRVVVLEFGRLISSGPPEAVRRDPEVVRAYLGSAAAEVMEADPARPEDDGTAAAEP